MERVDELAHGLLSLGLKPGRPFGILGNTSLEWALLDFALARLGVTVVPIYATSSDRDCMYVLEHSEAVGLVVESEAQRARVESLRGELPGIRHPLTFDDLDGLAESGRAHRQEHPDAVAEAEARTTEDDLLMIVYTSGTTGPPKGCMMLHKNYVAVVEALEESTSSARRATSACSSSRWPTPTRSSRSTPPREPATRSRSVPT